MIYDAEVRWSVPTCERAHRRIQIPDGFCFLISRETGKPIQPAFDFLSTRYLAGFNRLRLAASKHTIKAVVDDLVDFHHYLDACGLRVEQTDYEAFAGYLDSLLSIRSSATGRTYAIATVVRRRSSVARFLHHCQNQGILKHRFNVEEVAAPFKRVASFAPELPGPSVEASDRLVRAIDPRVLTLLMEELGSLPVAFDEGNLIHSGPLSTLRLMAELCLQSGLRRAEVCDLKIKSIKDAVLDGRSYYSSIAIKVVGKGESPRLL